MLAAMPAPLFDSWRAYFTLKASNENPELTRWDNEESAARKLAAKAAKDAAAAVKNPRKR